MYFDDAHHYNKKNLKPQDFTNNEYHKEDNEFFADSTDILDASKLISEFNTILHKSSYSYPNKSRDLSSLSKISDLVGDKEYYKEDDAISKD